MRTLTLLIAILSLPVQAADWYAETADKMGTRVEVHVYHDDADRAAELIAAGMAEFDRIEAAMSTYREDSELSRINREAAAGAVPVDPELAALIRRSLEVSAATDGAFDITYDSAGQHYDYRRSERPDADTLASAVAAIDYRGVELDEAAGTIRFAEPGMRLNLGGIAKGYAVERVVGLLREAGVSNAMAVAGGDTRVLGDRAGQPFVVGVRDPDSEEGVFTRLAVVNEAISTSGDYERFFIEDGVRYHHILNPGTGRPSEGVRSVTVIGPDATLTDALSTTLFVLGVEAGMQALAAWSGYEAIIIDAGRKLHYSPGLAEPGT